MLRHEGFDARSFTDPLKALSFSGFETPALLISEFAMSLLSGTELARQVWEHNPDCKVLLFSAQGMNRILGEGGGRTDQRFQILTMLVHPTTTRVNKENGLAS